jgi:hypothetical protein
MQMQIPSQAEVENAYSGDKPRLPEGKFVAVRRPTALVVQILKRSNNYYVTGDAGLAALGIADASVLNQDSPSFDPSAGTMLVYPVVEVLVLLCCSNQELYDFEDDFVYPVTKGKPGHLLRTRVRENMERFTVSEIEEFMPLINAEFEKVNQSMTVAVEEGNKNLKPGEE